MLQADTIGAEVVRSMEGSGEAMAAQRRLGVVRQASRRNLSPEPTHARAHRLGGIGHAPGVVQEQGGTRVGGALTKLAAAWLDPESLKELLEGFNKIL